MTELTEQQLEKIATTAARTAVKEVFEKFGVDVNDVRGSQADFAHLRKHRVASEQIGKFATRAVITLSVTGFCSAAWLGITTFLKT